MTRARSRPRRRVAMTLIELLLATAGVGLIAVAVASMMFATSAGTASSTDMRAFVVQHQTVGQRIENAVRQSILVLDGDSSHIVLWTADKDGSGLPNHDELQRIDMVDGELRSREVVWPANWNAGQITAANTSYALNANFSQITADVSESARFVTTVWARNVTALSLNINSGSPQTTTLVAYRATLQPGKIAETISGQIAHRNTLAEVEP